MRAGINELKNEIISYYNNEYGFAPEKKNVKIIKADKEHCVFECNGRIRGFDFNVTINMGDIHEVPLAPVESV